MKPRNVRHPRLELELLEGRLVLSTFDLLINPLEHGRLDDTLLVQRPEARNQSTADPTTLIGGRSQTPPADGARNSTTNQDSGLRGAPASAAPEAKSALDRLAAMVLPGTFSYVVIPELEKGSLNISAAYGANNALTEEQETGANAPGWYLPVNWSDDDKDGWTEGGAPPAAEYTGDKDDSYITGGDRDLFMFSVSLSFPQPPPPNPQLEGSLILTYDSSKIKVWRTPTKKVEGESSASSFVASSTNFTNVQLELNDVFYAEGIAGSSSFKDAFIQIDMVTVPDGVQMDRMSDRVDVTVFEATQVGFFTGDQHEDNQAKFSSASYQASSDKNGIISHYDPDQNCDHFFNCREMQATVKPSRPSQGFDPYENHGPPFTFDVSFYMRRQVYYAAWIKTGAGNWEPLVIQQKAHREWKNDDAEQGTFDRDMTISNSGHIYFIDAVGNRNKTRAAFDYLQQYADFRNWTTVNLYGENYQCSNFAKWHAQLVQKPKNDGTQDLIRDPAEGRQKLGENWITVPLVPDLTIQ